MYNFKKRGFCPNPNVQVKSFLFNESKLEAKNMLNKQDEA